MLSLVKLPNSVVLEIELDYKSRGQECLDKVCEILGIIEVDYFGLQYYGHHGELLWLNLRNPIKHQLTSACPYRLLFKVKFFVPPHLILQESTRQQFFLNLVTDLQDGRIRVNDRDLAFRLTALIAQIELGDFMVTTNRPDSPTETSCQSSNLSLSSLLLHYRKWLPFSLLDCSASSTTNAHSNLEISSVSGNCCNRFVTHSSPIPSRKNSSPAAVASCSNRRSSTESSEDHCSGRSRRKHHSGDCDHGADGALSSEGEGDSESPFSFSAPSSPYESLLLMSTSPPTSYSNIGAGRSCSLDVASSTQILTSTFDNEMPLLCDSVGRIHRTMRGMKQMHAKYLFLKEVSNLEDFGVEYFSVKANSNDHSLDHTCFKLGIGPRGVKIEAINNGNTVNTSSNNPFIALSVCTVDFEAPQSTAILTDQQSRTQLTHSLSHPTSQGINMSVPHSVLASKTSISYSSIQMATHSGRCLFLTYINDSGEANSIGFKCESAVAANAIYRAVTEKHAFYSCETVRNAVTSQFIRDLKGTIVSLFNEKTPLGKNYVFDIRRTCREVYDHTRRVLHQLDQGEQQTTSKNQSQVQHNQSTNIPVTSSKLTTGETCDELSNDLESTIDSLDASDDKNTPSSVKCTRTTCIEGMKKLASLRDSLLCRICMDSDACTAFFPCRHVVCCSDCSLLCDSCPICRSSIETTEKIYLPVSSCGKNAPNLHDYSSSHCEKVT